MRRFRLLFGLGSLILLTPIALLVHRALDGAATERSMRHQAVAERLFDEMERALSAFVLREEKRPFDDYRFTQVRPDGPDALRHSPLAYGPEWPFVVGHFQIDPDGSVHTPHEPRRGELPAEAPDFQPSGDMRAAITDIRRAVAAASRPREGAVRQTSDEREQQPGSTQVFGETVKELRVVPGEGSARVREAAPSVYEALRALNIGAEQRAARPAGVPSARGLAQAEIDSAPAARKELRDDTAPSGGAGVPEPASPGPRAREMALDPTPLAGHILGPHRLLLYRTVVHDRHGYRQGLLVDVDRLGAWLREQALGATGLARSARVDFGPPPVPAHGGDSGFTYVHRFAEPFDDLRAWLRLRPLPGVGDTTPVSALAALLIVATFLGLAALYRMVSVVLRYAEQRSNFVAAVTHELKTPLTAIRMYAEMLRDGIVPSPEKRDEYYRHITAESERLTRLVNNVLEFARLEKRARPVALESRPLAPLLEDVATMVRPHVEGAGFALTLDVAADLPPVAYDRDALTQILFNLVDNAVKYGANGATREILLRAWRDGTQVRVAVSDRGPGVASAHLRRIFQPFYRADTELTRRSKGTGLGLALVRGLAERMGARVVGRNLVRGGFEVEIAFHCAE